MENFAHEVDSAFWFISTVSALMLIGITAAMLYMLYRYHHKRNTETKDIEGDLRLEITWTIIPTVIVMIMFAYGVVGFNAMRNIPEDAMVINVVGQQWKWSFEYENGARVAVDKGVPEFFVPLNKPVAFHMNSVDVLHSFYLRAFRVKEDVVPGRETRMWVFPDALGSFDVQCAEYCGLSHWDMFATMTVLSQEEFDTWYKSVGSGAETEKGTAVAAP